MIRKLNKLVSYQDLNSASADTEKFASKKLAAPRVKLKLFNG
jgi:hypothetical protein